MKTKEELRQYKREWAMKKYGRTKESMKNSETYKGRRAELLAIDILGGKDMNNEAMNRSYDIELKDGTKIDVKSCNLYRRKNKKGKPVIGEQSGCWIFNKNKGYADKYFCICMINNVPVKHYLIPKDKFNNGITMGRISTKFNKYLINKTI